MTISLGGSAGSHGPGGTLRHFGSKEGAGRMRARVLLEFIVTKTGAVANPVVIEASPPGIFDRAAINAALKFKYKPKVVDGEPIDVAGVRNRITFELAD